MSNASNFHQNVCSCPECRETINRDISNFTLFGESSSKVVKRGYTIVTMEFPTSETKERCLKHYLQIKASEYKFSGNSSKNEILQDLSDGINQYEEVIGLDGISHLELWKRILSD